MTDDNDSTTVDISQLTPREKSNLNLAKRGNKPKWNKKIALAFLENYSKTGNKTASAAAIGFSISQIKLKKKTDPWFAEELKKAEENSGQMLLDEAHRRAVWGDKKAIYHQGQVVGEEYVKSDRLLEVLMKGRFPEMFSTNQNVTIKGDSENPITVTQTKSKLIEMMGGSLEDIEDGEFTEE